MGEGDGGAETGRTRLLDAAKAVKLPIPVVSFDGESERSPVERGVRMCEVGEAM